jgi:hypothetical protein
MSSLRSKRRRTKELYESMVKESAHTTEPVISTRSIEQCPVFEVLSPRTDSGEHSRSEEDTSGSDENKYENSSNDLNLKSQVAKWAVRHNITSVAIDDILGIMRRNFPNEGLPKSSKTLLHTPNSYEIIDIKGGQYFHFGLRNQLTFFIEQGLTTDNLTFQLKIGIDGVSVCNSNRKQFWPILSSCDSVSQGKPFLIGVYFSKKEKPGSASEFLAPFVAEMRLLSDVPFTCLGKTYKIEILCIVCDTPARNFVKCSAAFNGYYGCDRCVQKGVWNGRVTYPSSSDFARTDEDFKSQLYPKHHHGISPIIDLDVGMVTDFVLDYMHLVCHGVVRKLLFAWCEVIPHKLGRHDINNLSSKLVTYSNCIPREFHRKPRRLDELRLWKATEFRTFLLYLGIVALKSILPSSKYRHFLLLSVALRILLTDVRSWYSYARELLHNFVQLVPELYGEEFLVYNVHSLVHLADDAFKFGSLNRISAFPFESYLMQFKRLLRGKRSELPQLIRRVYERQLNSEIDIKDCISSRRCFLSSENSNSCVLLRDDEIAVIECVNGDRLTIRKFSNKDDFFVYPCPSSKFSIYTVSSYSQLVSAVDRSHVKQKLMLLPNIDESFVCIPIISSWESV